MHLEIYELLSINTTNKSITSHRTVGRPRWNRGSSLIEQDVAGLLADIIFRYRLNVAVIEAIPLSIDGVLTVSYKHTTQ